jgi:hypothetical protein
MLHRHQRRHTLCTSAVVRGQGRRVVRGQLAKLEQGDKPVTSVSVGETSSNTRVRCSGFLRHIAADRRDPRKLADWKQGAPAVVVVVGVVGLLFGIGGSLRHLDAGFVFLFFLFEPLGRVLLNRGPVPNHLLRDLSDRLRCRLLLRERKYYSRTARLAQVNCSAQ